MSIKLGLQRINKLIQHLPDPQLLNSLKIIHVGGTNGKGSICSYLQSIIMNTKAASSVYRVGKYCSPHLIHPSDSITINNLPITQDNYLKYMDEMDTVNNKFNIEASKFEMLTCVALRWFHENKVDFAIIEVGVGGETDATNIIPGSSKIAVNLSKISLDHTNLLGNTLEKIAIEKSGIIKPQVGKVFINGNNEKSVLDILCNKCETEKVPYEIVTVSNDGNTTTSKVIEQVEGYQKENVAMALANINYLHSEGFLPQSNESDIIKGIKEMEWPGRLQNLQFKYTRNKQTPVLIDGAHNEDGARQLGGYLDTHYRKGPSTSLTFVLAMTEGKDVTNVLKHVLRPKDIVVITRFGSVTDMPWIESMQNDKLFRAVSSCVLPNHILTENSLQSAIPVALFNKINQDLPIVVFGSLYLAGQLLSLHYANTKD